MSFRLSFLVDLRKIYLALREYANCFFASTRKDFCDSVCTGTIQESEIRAARSISEDRKQHAQFFAERLRQARETGNYFDNFGASSIDGKAKRELVFS